MKQVRNLNTLKALQRANLVKFCNDTGMKMGVPFSDKKHTMYYIDGETANTSFEFNGKKYTVKYVDGCFYPYVYVI